MSARAEVAATEVCIDEDEDMDGATTTGGGDADKEARRGNAVVDNGAGNGRTVGEEEAAATGAAPV